MPDQAGLLRRESRSDLSDRSAGDARGYAVAKSSRHPGRRCRVMRIFGFGSLRRQPNPDTCTVKILIADSIPSFVTRMFTELETSEHAVDRVFSGRAALQFLITRSFNVLVLAPRLPRLDAQGVCRRLREELRDNTPVVIFEETESLADTLAAFRVGADDVVRAHIDSQELEARLRALVRRRDGRVSAATLRVGDLTLRLRI